ncbi:uncharacterized protein LOC115416830 isoform X3 [Sphaeramia orbicularis]|uniref:uncharacterized protein LOC115416830 isoform X3 n=1 Tax=Sphaeramia orbicularis TaxID=375764 RepID=UPI0011815533|nr:uncharacterized protein LOC115416830 isoform X3 [Sphaeramia orbicularis]
MGTQGPGRKRIPNLEKLTAEDDALNSIAREAEARLAAKRAARAEAREIRMKELERQQKEVSDDEEKLSVGSRGSLRPSDYSGVLGSGSRTSSRASSARASPVVEERPERDFIDKGSRTASTLSAATLASLGGASSRRGSCDTSFSVETEASIRDMKDSLAELEERYRRAMVSNAQLHNDKSTLMYQVETLKEELSDLEELLWEERRTCDERSKDLERQRQNNSVLQFQLGGATETLRRTEELLTDLSQLRLQSSSFSQQISDLQETLEWKHNRILALERQREISDIVEIERDRLRGEVVQLRSLLKEHGVVVSDDVTTNGETEQNDAEDDVSAQSASRLAEEASHGGRQSMMGKVRDQDVLQTDAERQNPTGSCPQNWTSSSSQRFRNEEKNAEIFSVQPPPTSRNDESPTDTSPSQSLKPDLKEDRFRVGSVSECLLVSDRTEDGASGHGYCDDRSPPVLVRTFTDRILLEELLRRFRQHQNFAEEFSERFPEMSECLHRWVSGLEEPRGEHLKRSVEGGRPPQTLDRSERPTPGVSMESTNEGRKDILAQNNQERPKDPTEKLTMTRTGSDVRRSAETEHVEDFVLVDFYCTERVQTRFRDPRGKTTTARHREDADQRRSPPGNPKASTDSQSSKVRRGGMKVTAVPDWSSEGGTAEEWTGLSGLTDSCEEADEEAVTPQDRPSTEKVFQRTREKPRGNCRIC